jgi:hypothetical protein
MAVRVAQSRAVAVPLEAAYDGTIVVPLAEIFRERHLALPPVVRVDDQDGSWGRAVGQTRTIRTSDGGSLRETLEHLDRPHRFGYRIDRVTGPMRPLVRHLDGLWTFERSGAGTTITWSWEMTPTSRLMTPPVAVVGRMWHGYARCALETLDAILTT